MFQNLTSNKISFDYQAASYFPGHDIEFRIEFRIKVQYFSSTDRISEDNKWFITWKMIQS